MKQAKAIGCTDRQVRRYRQEAEQAELIETKRGPLERDPDGRIRRSMTNMYVFLVPKAKGKPRSHRADMDDRTTQSLTGLVETLGNQNQHLSRRPRHNRALPSPDRPDTHTALSEIRKLRSAIWGDAS